MMLHCEQSVDMKQVCVSGSGSVCSRVEMWRMPDEAVVMGFLVSLPFRKHRRASAVVCIVRGVLAHLPHVYILASMARGIGPRRV